MGLEEIAPGHWIPYDGPFEELGTTPSRMISAVDVNRARAALQNLYPPRIFGASTSDLEEAVYRTSAATRFRLSGWG
ncbi:MAG TPA: hypothetical protein VFI90_16630 [Rubrobacter sp.]|nr:hypothetical protein [Rubrobacter sp.]